jgi:hypothetical protein|tara:strand:- start:197 stop:334 length:138 start_codon:yes stop_codon:yes gene_type:complete
MKDFVSVKDYAKSENISVQAVYQRIAKNSIKYQKIGSVFLIKKEK